MRVIVTEDAVQVRLALWQKIFGLMRDITVARSDVGAVAVVADPLAVVMRAGLKVGLRAPGLYYVARTIRLDQAFVVRRGVPALEFEVRDGRPLKRVLVSTPEAAQLARVLGAG